MNAGSVTIERGDETTSSWAPVRTRLEARRSRAAPARGPYSSTWHVTGDPTLEHDTLTLEHEIPGDASGITTARTTTAADFLAAVETAAVITTPAGVFTPLAVLETQVTPITTGILVRVKVATRRARTATDAALRFVSGPVWELR